MSTVWKADQKAQNTVEKAVKYKENRFLCVKGLLPTQQDSASFIVHVCFFGAQAAVEIKEKWCVCVWKLESIPTTKCWVGKVGTSNDFWVHTKSVAAQSCFLKILQSLQVQSRTWSAYKG